MRLFQSMGKSHHEPRQACLFSDHGSCTHDNLSALRCQTQRRSQDQRLLLLRSILGNVLCPVDLQRVSQRHRSQSANPSKKTLSFGISVPNNFAKYAFECKRNSLLADLRRLRAILDWDRQTPLCSRPLGDRFGCGCLRLRRDDDRPLPVCLSLGSVSHNQGCGEDAHPLGFAWKHTQFHSHYRREDPRSQHPGSAHHRGWSLLFDGPRVLGFCKASQDSSIPSILCDQDQKQYQISTQIFATSGQSEHQCHQRSSWGSAFVYCKKRLSRHHQARHGQRRQREKIQLLDQQHDTQARAHCGPLPPKMAGGIVLQMDQTAFANQEIFGYNRERSQNTNLDRSVYLRAHCDRKKTIETRSITLRNSTNLESVHV